MQIDKQQILSVLHGLGDQHKVDQAQAELPDQVDTDQHAGILDKLGSGGPVGALKGKLGL